MKKLLFVVLAVCLLCCAGVVMSHAAVDITEEFTDLNFRAAVYWEIGKTAPAPIYDTDVAKKQSLYVDYRNITSLDGLEYFTSLRAFGCEGNQITELPVLPSGLLTLYCGMNPITELPALPRNLQYLYCRMNRLTALPALPSGLLTLDCGNSYDGKGDPLVELEPENMNRLTSLPALPNSLRSLTCDGNQLTSLPLLPASLTYLYCNDNLLTSLPALPSKLSQLCCQNNQLSSLPALPSGLESLYCQNNKLASLNVTGLPLYALNCSYNNMTSKAAVTGFTGTWGVGYFVFDPQNPVSPALTGPTSLSLAQGYADTATGAFTATGNPVPTVAKTDGDEKITWNDTTKRLDIAAGLTAGTYPVKIKASNGVSPDAELTFTLTITSPPPPKGIFGTNPKWSGAWWHYLLFFFCFGFIWMWF